MKLKIKEIVVLIIILCAVAVVASADDGHGHDHHDDGSVVDINSPLDIDINGPDIGGDSFRSLALVAPGMGDVDIAQCVGSTQFTLLVGGKQKLVLIWPCMAEFYLKLPIPRYDLAAQALCNQPEILEEYKTELACEIDHDFSPPETEGDDEFDTVSFYQYVDDIEQIQMQQSSLVVQLDEVTEQLNRPRPQPEPVIKQQPEPKYTDEDQAYILGLYADGEDEDE